MSTTYRIGVSADTCRMDLPTRAAKICLTNDKKKKRKASRSLGDDENGDFIGTIDGTKWLA